MSRIADTPIPAMSAKIEKLTKELEWYKAYADNVQGTNHRVHEYSCEYADKVTSVIEYPYNEGDNYWTIEETDKEYDDTSGCYSNGIIAIQSCWDEQSEELHQVNPDMERYFDSLEEILKVFRDKKDFIKVECFDSGYPDIKNGAYFVADEVTGKFTKSY